MIGYAETLRFGSRDNNNFETLKNEEPKILIQIINQT
jgi:hypothetical protein